MNDKYRKETIKSVTQIPWVSAWDRLPSSRRENGSGYPCTYRIGCSLLDVADTVFYYGFNKSIGKKVGHGQEYLAICWIRWLKLFGLRLVEIKNIRLVE